MNARLRLVILGTLAKKEHADAAETCAAQSGREVGRRVIPIS